MVETALQILVASDVEEDPQKDDARDREPRDAVKEVKRGPFALESFDDRTAGADDRGRTVESLIANEHQDALIGDAVVPDIPDQNDEVNHQVDEEVPKLRNVALEEGPFEENFHREVIGEK